MTPAQPPKSGSGPSPAEARIARLYHMLQAGLTHDVEREARDVLSCTPDDVAMLRVLATSLLLQKRMQDAIEPLQHATRIDPEHGETWIRLGLCLDARGNHEDAAVAYRQGLARDPSQPASWINAATNAYQRKAWTEAEEQARKGLAHVSDHPRLLLELGKALREQGRNTEALDVLEHARNLEPRNPYVLEAIALTLENLLRIPEAIEIREELFAERPTDRVLRDAMYKLLRQEGRLNQIVDFLDRVEAAGIADDAAFACYRGEALATQGHTEEAIAAWEQALARDPCHVRSARNYIQHCWLATDSALAGQMRAVLGGETPILDDRSRSKAACILGKIHWDHGEFDQAWEYYVQGNRLFRNWVHSEGREEDTGTFTVHGPAVRSAFPSAVMRDTNVSASEDSRPLFILGMPRSGKTLLESQLQGNPAIAPGGECSDASRLFEEALKHPDDDISRPEAILSHLRAAAPAEIELESANYLERISRFGSHAQYITQTLPTILLYAGIIHLLFPSARFIFCRRDYEDLGLSCFANDFAQAGMVYTTDLYRIGQEIRASEALMDHWLEVLPAGTVLDIRYEDLVSEPEATMARVHRHLDLTPPTPSPVDGAGESAPAAPAFAITPANPGRPRPDFIGIAAPVRHHLEPLHRGYAEES